MTEHLADEYSVATDSSLDLDLIPVPDTTIADLPNEVIEQVFVLNSLHDFQHVHNPAQTIRRTSQVCQRWRVIALNTPLLWAHILDLESCSRWIEEVLDRARSVPLDLVLPCMTKDLMDKSWAPTMLQKLTSFDMIDLATTRAPKIWHSLWFLFDEELLKKCLPKTRSILLSVSPSNWSLFLRPIMIDYLPKLERLSLVTSEMETGLFGDGGQLTGGPPWNLCSLNLRNCNFLFNGLSLPSLEELTIHHLPLTQALPPSTWLSILENLPKLKSLELINVTGTLPWTTQGDKRAVQLVDLQWLLLAGPLPHCVNILENLVIPPSCKLDLLICGFSSLCEEFYSLVNIIQQKFNAAEDVIFNDTLRLSISPRSFIFNAVNSEDSFASTRPRSFFRLSMAWQTAFDDAGVPPPYINPFIVLNAMITALRKPCMSVTGLFISLDVAAESKERMKILAGVFSHFNNLKYLYHISPSTLPFLLSYFEFLSQPNRMAVEDESGTDYSKLLPLMNSISFLGVNFASLHPSSPNLLKILHDFVAIRRVDLDVSPITRMSFGNCRAMSKKRINRLVNAGVQVNLDKGTCKNCDILNDTPYGWRMIFPLAKGAYKLDSEIGT